jgi:hypothetical protein
MNGAAPTVISNQGQSSSVIIFIKEIILDIRISTWLDDSKYVSTSLSFLLFLDVLYRFKLPYVLEPIVHEVTFVNFINKTLI